MAERPIFYDASGKRRRRFAVAVFAFVALAILAVSLFVTSVVTISSETPLPFEPERPPITGASRVGALAHDAGHGIRRALRAASWFLSGKPPTKGSRPLAISFYVPWDDSSAASLSRHIGDVDWLVPAWISVTGPAHTLTVYPDIRGRRIFAASSHKPLLLPMVQNAHDGDWDGPGIAKLLHDPVASKSLLDRVEPFLLANHAAGVFFDFEALPPSAQRDYLRFLKIAHDRFAAKGLLVAISAPAGDRFWNLRAYAAIVDKIVVMAYDEHFQGGPPGPIASQPWFSHVVTNAVRGLPPEKVVIAVGSYAYDWAQGGDTQVVSVEDAWLAAHESDATPTFDATSANSSFTYMQQGALHTVWMLDAASAYNQIAALRAAGINGLALWRMGTEDPSIWQIFGRRITSLPAAKVIQQIPAGTDVDIEGTGEILRVGAVPVPGVRDVSVDKRGLIVSTAFRQLPLPYVIQRAGNRPGLVALTFDDGPDPTWTPKILDILKQYQVHGTFFVIGENALTEHGLLKRLVAEGHEVGNHSYTHPNLGMATPQQTALELNATQRLFQAFTGRSMRLFRAPFFGDAEPTTADEINPVYQAQTMGYLSVGLHVDPDDWKRPGVQHIVDTAVQGVLAATPERSGQVVLLHDGGGDRSQTVEALPQIITQLRARGYRFVLASELIGLKSTDVMPPLTASDQAAAQTDLALFSTLGAIVIGLRWLFFIAISIGIARALLLSGLALAESWRESRLEKPEIDPDRFVSVLIPAFNEARVIEASVRRVLESEDVHLEVIVIDDGSKDDTSAIVARAFSDDPRVRLLTLENGGKARALNEGLKLAQGDIVIALDADTQFEPLTIARLARWFADPELGAVAGNAKVGNRINLITRWQALEYVTAQNLERRALALINAITVVPGAVGAWRAETLRTVGGFPGQTLAEDQDLTIMIQREGWKVIYDQRAVAWTEAPESFGTLARQRFRWAFGTLQCLWKHRKIMRTGTPRGLARVGLPQALVFQIGFAMISPVIDLALLVSIVATGISVHEHGWAATQGDLWRMLTYWVAFTAIDLLAGVVAFALERKERWSLLWLMIPQRFGYRQIMYYVVIKAVTQALRGPRVGWGKLERSGRVASN
ncbi:polysaccharide deacetylase family protein [Flavisphingomonas formosensis]|uniref:polysaccharide deacetylase family protein n=1 Tax=Flavisphingomonas formosensis TaxID=861534 RepID=UPI0012FB6801|nr:glycosyltransferase [Sphingomonas formosensis]